MKNAIPAQDLGTYSGPRLMPRTICFTDVDNPQQLGGGVEQYAREKVVEEDLHEKLDIVSQELLTATMKRKLLMWKLQELEEMLKDMRVAPWKRKRKQADEEEIAKWKDSDELYEFHDDEYEDEDEVFDEKEEAERRYDVELELAAYYHDHELFDIAEESEESDGEDDY